MNKHILSGSIASLLFAPDIDAGGGITIPAAPPGPAPSATDVILGNQPSIESSNAVKAVEGRPKENSLKGPESFGGEPAAQSLDKITGEGRKRGPDGKFLPAEGKEAPQKPAKAPPATKPLPAVQKPVAVKPAPLQAIPAKPEATKPAIPAKVKIGGQEKTAEEWEAHFRALEEKSKAPAAPAEPAIPDPGTVKLTPEQEAAQAAAEAERERAFVEKSLIPAYEMTVAEHDAILAGGPEAVKAHAGLMAKTELRARKFAAQEINKVYEEMDKRLAAFGPVMKNHEQVSRLMEETAFLGQHPDIKDHPEGAKTFAKVSQQYNNGITALLDKVATGKATPSEQAWAQIYKDSSAEQRLGDIAHYTREELAKLPKPEAAKPKSPPELSIVESPLSTERPQGSTVIRTESLEQRRAREANQAAGVA